jgi:hypothetical protein
MFLVCDNNGPDTSVNEQMLAGVDFSIVLGDSANFDRFLLQDFSVELGESAN